MSTATWSTRDTPAGPFTAVVDDDGVTTYAELEARTDSLALALLDSGAGPGAGSAPARSSRPRRAVSDRVASRKRRQATVTSQPFGSRGGSAGQVRRASVSASCTASSAAAKPAPRRPRIPSTSGTRPRSSAASAPATSLLTR